jgi:hypothetical protein
MSRDYLSPFVKCIEELDILHLDGLITLQLFFDQSRDGCVTTTLDHSNVLELQNALRDCIVTLHMLTTALRETLARTNLSDNLCAYTAPPKIGDRGHLTEVEAFQMICVLEESYEDEFGVQDVLLSSVLAAGNIGETVTSAMATIFLATWRAQTGLKSNVHWHAARKQLLDQ